jgi:superfamily II DNA or RNA helicase
MPTFQPLPYQNTAIQFSLDRIYLRGESGAGLFCDPGLGKTGMSLSIIQTLKDLGEVSKVLVVGPKRVIYTVWEQEIEKFGFDLTCSLVHGTVRQREKALKREADIYLASSDGVVWLSKLDRRFDLSIIDESTAYKNWSSDRSKSIRKMTLGKTIILTGTPASDNLIDLYPQVYLVGGGRTLGENVTRFRAKYCMQCGFENREWKVRPEMEAQLFRDVAEYCITMKAEDHLDMPERVINDILVDLPDDAQAKYNGIERELITELEEGTLVAMSEGSKYQMLRQMASGGTYVTDMDSGERVESDLHNAKVEAVKELVGELQGKPLLLGYGYSHEMRKLKKAFPKAEVVNGDTSGKETKAIIQRWISGKCKLLLCQHQAMSHGINGLQTVGNDVCWYTLPDRAETYTQFNARIYRQGQKACQVRIHRILARRTLDLVARRRTDAKTDKEAELRNAIEQYWMEKNGV